MVATLTVNPGEEPSAHRIRELIKLARSQKVKAIIAEKGLPENIAWVRVEPSLEEEYTLYQANLTDIENPVHHDSAKLAQVITDLFYEKTGPLAG